MKQIDEHKDEIWAICSQADDLWEEGKPDAAIALLRKALTLGDDDPKYIPIYDSIAEIQWSEGDRKAAIATYREALACHPEDDDLWYYLGDCLVDDHQDREAIEVFEQALQINPRNDFVWYPFAVACARWGDGERAQTYLNKALKNNPQLWKTAQEEPALAAYLPPSPPKQWWEFWKR